MTLVFPCSWRELSELSEPEYVEFMKNFEQYRDLWGEFYLKVEKNKNLTERIIERGYVYTILKSMSSVNWSEDHSEPVSLHGLPEQNRNGLFDDNGPDFAATEEILEERAASEEAKAFVRQCREIWEGANGQSLGDVIANLLPTEDRTTIDVLVAFYDRKSFKQSAHDLGIPHGTLRKRCYRLFQDLRELLDPG